MRNPRLLLSALSGAVGLLAVSSGAQDRPEPDMISPGDAVHRAEVFVAENGYALAEPNADRFVPELFDDLMPREDVLRRRHNSLRSAAYGYMYGSATILVFFPSADDQSPDPQFVRVVRMRPDGSEVTMAHQGFMFSLSPIEQPDRCEIPPWFAEDGLLYPRPDGLTEPLQPTRNTKPRAQTRPPVSRPARLIARR